MFVLANLFEYFKNFKFKKIKLWGSSLYFEYFEIQKNQNIQNIFVLANLFEYFVFFWNSPGPSALAPVPLGPSIYIWIFRIQKNQKDQTTVNTYFLNFLNSKSLKNKQMKTPKVRSWSPNSNLCIQKGSIPNYVFKKSQY